MRKLPYPPVTLFQPPQVLTLPKGTTLARIFFASGKHATRWHTFRHFGPTDGRFDHHLPDAQGQAHLQTRGVYYAAEGATAFATCLAEVFQTTRIIDRRYNSPVLVVFCAAQELALLDLRSAFATKMGASTAIHSGARRIARRWAQQIYSQYPQLDGIAYCSSMYANTPVTALFERAKAAVPGQNRLHRPLADPALASVVYATARQIGYQVI